MLKKSRPPCEVVNWKVKHQQFKRTKRQVDLLVRSWIESRCRRYELLRKFVDLLVRSWIERSDYPYMFQSGDRRPPCEVVNWKSSKISSIPCETSRPPCEVVNWKVLVYTPAIFLFVDLLVRSWIERKITSVNILSATVDLLVRSWIERDCQRSENIEKAGSTSLWGRELKERSLNW